MSDIKEKISNESGSALILVLLLVVTFSIIGSSLIYVTFVHRENTIKRELQQQSYYAAETGIMDGIKQIEQNRTPTSNVENLIPKNYPSESKTTYKQTLNDIGNELSYELKLTKGTGTEFTLESTGQSKISDNLEKTTVITAVLDKNRTLPELKENTLFNHSIFSNKTLYLGQEFATFDRFTWEYKYPITNAIFSGLNVKDISTNIDLSSPAILKNNVEVIGNVHSGDEVYKYNGDYIGQWLYLPVEWWGPIPTKFEWKFVKLGGSDNLLGIQPTLIDSNITTGTNDGIKDTGIGLNLAPLPMFFYLKESSSNQNKVSKSFNTSTLATTIESSRGHKHSEDDLNKTIRISGQGNVDNITIYEQNDLGDIELGKLSDYVENGLLHVNGDVLISEGTQITTNDLVIIADGGFILGAKSTNEVSEEKYDNDNSIVEDKSVRIIGENILFLAKGTLKDTLKNYSSLRNYPIYDRIFTGLNGATSYHNKYFGSSSIVVNAKSQVDGWLIGNDRIVFDYKTSNSKFLADEPERPDKPNVKINGGIIADEIVFPEVIKIAKDLYIYDWDVQYN